MTNHSTSTTKLILFTIVSLIFIVPSCKKQDDFLNIKSNKSDITPTTLQDFQAVLDNATVMNSYSSILGLVGTDNLYIPDANLNAIDQVSRNAYLWAADIFAGTQSPDWFGDYQTIEYANIVLDGLSNLSVTGNPAAYNNVKGSALFYRAFAFYEASQLFCKAYDAATAGSDPGIPTRTSSDVNVKAVRGTVQQTYDQITGDLKIAADLLPQTPVYKTRPSAVSANALLAKVYLAKGDYANAFLYADNALKGYSSLLDYNTLTFGKSNPFPSFKAGHPEIVYYALAYGLNTVFSVSSVKSRVAPELYQSYEAADLRTKAFYVADGTTGLYKFKGTYSTPYYNFCGIATDEIYLIRAEASARTGNMTQALADLNTLLQNRYSHSAFSPYYTADAKTLIARILLERRKEMPFTGNLRWEDLRRINSDPQYAVTLTRTANGQNYSLAPNDNKYVYPLPSDAIQLDGLQQNPR